jgi:hypothetical protein
MKPLFVLFAMLLCGCESAVIPPPVTAPVIVSKDTRYLEICQSSLGYMQDKIAQEKRQEKHIVQTPQLVMPDMVYFCTVFDVKDQLKCLKWEKSYKAMICIGKDCKTWTQGNPSEPFGNLRD